MIDITKTYTTPDDYENLKGVNLTEELIGSTDHDEKAAQLMIFRVERNLINWLTRNREFTKDMIETNESTKESFIIAVCDQIEWFIDQGILTPTAVDEYMQQHKVFICEAAESELHTHGLANWRSQ